MATKKKVTVFAKARPIPDAANRPKTKIAGMKKSNTRMEPALPDRQAKKVATKKKKKS